MSEILMLPAPGEVLLLPPHDPLPDVERALADMFEAAREVVDMLAEALRPVLADVFRKVKQIVRAIMEAIIPKRWLYLSRHAKKRRVRKKYENRIRRRIQDLMNEIQEETT